MTGNDKEKICFFKMGRFPLISESHISNKISNIKGFSPVILCSELNLDENASSYLKKLVNSKIFAFRKVGGKSKSLAGKIKSGAKSAVKSTGIHKLIKFTDLIAPEFVVRISTSVFRAVSEFNISIKNRRSKMFFFAEKIKDEKIKIIDGCYGWEIIPLSILRKHAQFKIILSIRGKDLAMIKKYGCIRDLCRNYADLILTRSEFMRQEMISLGFDSKMVSVNHSGCDVKTFIPKERNLELSTDRILRIISIGRLVEKKGQIFLLKACRILKDKKIPFHLTIIGNGPLKRKLERFISRNGLSGNVEIIPEVQNDILPEYLSKKDIFVLPSIVADNNDAEGIPVSLMEAMASGLVCISTRCVGIPELLEDGKEGFLVEERNPVDIAKAICDIFRKDKEILSGIRSAAVDKVRKEFNSEIQSSRFEKHVRSLIEN